MAPLSPRGGNCAAPSTRQAPPPEEDAAAEPVPAGSPEAAQERSPLRHRARLGELGELLHQKSVNLKVFTNPDGVTFSDLENARKRFRGYIGKEGRHQRTNRKPNFLPSPPHASPREAAARKAATRWR